MLEPAALLDDAGEVPADGQVGGGGHRIAVQGLAPTGKKDYFLCPCLRI